MGTILSALFLIYYFFSSKDEIKDNNFIKTTDQETIEITTKQRKPNTDFQTKAGTKGALFIALAYETVQRGEDKYSKSMALVKKMQNILQGSIREQILKSNDPRQTLEEIESTLKKLEISGKNSIDSIKSFLSTNQQEINNKKKQIQVKEKQFFLALNQNKEAYSNVLFEEFIQEKNKLIRLQAEHGRAKSIGNKILKYYSMIQEKQKAISHNREALIAGVKFDMATAKNVDLAKEKSEIAEDEKEK